MPQANYHPTLYTYLKKYQDDPGSRVFAPLAEAYRKAGLVDEAIEIAREGVKFHPRFMGGRVALARALFDKQLYQEVVDELSPIVHDIPDNLVAQRLLGESYLILGQVAEALEAYKMLLYFSPLDQETAQIVQELEAQAYEKGALVLRSDPSAHGDTVDRSSGAISDFDVRSVSGAIASSPEAQRSSKVKRIERLQSLLQKVERYRIKNEMRTGHKEGPIRT